MTAPDAPQVEPLKLTSGTGMVPMSYVRDESGVFHELTIHLPPGTKWVGEERRDDTAELVEAATELLEATEAANAWESGLLDSSPSDYEDWEAENRKVHERHANAYAALAAALARVKGGAK